MGLTNRSRQASVASPSEGLSFRNEAFIFLKLLSSKTQNRMATETRNPNSPTKRIEVDARPKIARDVNKFLNATRPRQAPTIISEVNEAMSASTAVAMTIRVA